VELKHKPYHHKSSGFFQYCDEKQKPNTTGVPHNDHITTVVAAVDETAAQAPLKESMPSRGNTTKGSNSWKERKCEMLNATITTSRCCDCSIF